MSNLNHHINELKDKGFTVMKVSDQTSQYLCKHFKNEMKFKRKKDNISSFYPVTTRDKLKSILNLEILKLITSYKLKKFIKLNSFKKIADGYFGEESLLTKIDSYLSYPSNENILNWHTDMANPQFKKNSINEINPINPNRGLLKFSLFLTDSSNDNVSFAVIPKSHKISIAYKELIYKNLIEYKKYWSITDFKKILNDKKIIEKLIDATSQETLDNFIQNIDFDEEMDTNKFDIHLNITDVVIFDEHTYHRAKSPKNRNRFIFRFCYGKKKTYTNLS